MKLGSQRHRYHRQRGAVGSVPEESPSLPELLQQLEGLQTRLQQLKTGVANLVQLQQLQAEAPSHDGEGASQEILRLQEATESFEIELASRVMSWQHLQEPFWQAVRFGGLGLVVGWFLAWLAYGR